LHTVNFLQEFKVNPVEKKLNNNNNNNNNNSNDTRRTMSTLKAEYEAPTT